MICLFSGKKLTKYLKGKYIKREERQKKNKGRQKIVLIFSLFGENVE